MTATILSLAELTPERVAALNAREIAAARGEPTNAELDALAVRQDQEQQLAALADMSPADYAKRRTDLAGELGISVTFLDEERRERQKAARGEVQPTGFPGWDAEPWPEPVAGDDLLDCIAITAGAHVKLPKGGADALALWVTATHAHDAFQISPILAATSPTPACGKTTLLSLVGGLVPKPLPASNITAAALFRAVEKWRPTVLIDEADTFLRGSDELRGIINCGHTKASAYVIRTTGENHEPARFSTWAPKAIALIGKLPATLASRAIHIELRRKTAKESITPLRFDRMEHLDELKAKAARWAADNLSNLRGADPEVPDWLHGRDADNWRPLLAVADAAGGDWPARAREVARRISDVRTEQAAGITLLEDVRAIFENRGDDRITSAEIVDALAAMEDRPWPEWKGGKAITARQLARLLEPFGIAPTKFRTDGHTPGTRGYEMNTFTDAFARYLPSRSATPPQPAEISHFPIERSATT